MVTALPTRLEGAEESARQQCAELSRQMEELQKRLFAAQRRLERLAIAGEGLTILAADDEPVRPSTGPGAARPGGTSPRPDLWRPAPWCRRPARRDISGWPASGSPGIGGPPPAAALPGRTGQRPRSAAVLGWRVRRRSVRRLRDTSCFRYDRSGSIVTPRRCNFSPSASAAQYYASPKLPKITALKSHGDSAGFTGPRFREPPDQGCSGSGDPWRAASRHSPLTGQKYVNSWIHRRLRDASRHSSRLLTICPFLRFSSGRPMSGAGTSFA